MEHFITEFAADWGYVAIFVLMLLESACIPFPSEVTMLFAGYLVSRGEMDLFTAGMMGTLGNLVGSWLAYWIGLKTGRALLVRFGKYVMIREHEIDRAEAWFNRYGEMAVFLSRMLPVVRTFISVPAGMAKMNFWKFTLYTFIGCLPWVYALTYAGELLGEHWDSIVGEFTVASFIIAAILGGLFVAWYIRRKRAARASADV